MTGPQESLYWRLWNRAAIQQGWTRLPSPERDAKRHAAHVQALGADKSHKKFNNADCDRIFRLLKVLADPNDLTKAVDLVEHQGDKGERGRLLYHIRELGEPEYIEAIARDKFDTTRLDDLNLVQLDQLRITLIERKRARDRRARIDAVTTPGPVQAPIEFPTGHPVVHYNLKLHQYHKR